MALIKEPYGLVYNTDGSLCVTYRDDDIPFPGVRSFAVETATTNLITNMNLTTWSRGGTWDSSYVRLTGEYFMGQPVAEFGKPGEDRTTHVDRYLQQTFSNLTEGDVYTFSIYVYVIEAGYCGTDISDSGIWIRHTSETNCVKFIDLPTNKWVRVEVTETVDSDLKAVPRIDIDNSYIRLACPQFEKKPFASSFVNGTRPSGRLVISVEDLKFDIANDDWVISYWKYPVATLNNSLTSYNCFVIGHDTPDYTHGYILWGKNTNYNRFILAVHLSGNTRSISYSSIFDSDWYFRHWHHEVLLKHGNELQYWVDGTLQIQVSLTTTLNSNFILGMAVGCDEINQPHNSYIANLYYGLYTDQWTDEYIREVYEAKIPFSEQNKLLIY